MSCKEKGNLRGSKSQNLYDLNSLVRDDQGVTPIHYPTYTESYNMFPTKYVRSFLLHGLYLNIQS